MKCSQKTCTHDASCSYVWPGQTERTYACAQCYSKAKNISNAMGFYLGDFRYEALATGDAPPPVGP